MATPQIGQRATLNGKPVIWSGNHKWQSPTSYLKLQQQGKFNLGTQELDRAVSSVSNSPILKRLQQAQQSFRNTTDKLGLDKVERVVNTAADADSRLPVGRAAQGAATLADKVGLDPRLLLIGMLRGGPSWKRPTSAEVNKATRGALRSNLGKPSPTTNPRPAPPSSNQSRLAKAADDALAAKAVRDSGTANQRQQLAQSLRGVDVASESRGPALKQFGGRTISPDDDNLSVGQQGGTGGRPSASQSSPLLRQIREGVRKATGLQLQLDELNAHRSGGGPGPNKVQPALPVNPERQPRIQAALDKQQAARANQQDPRTITNARSDNYGLDDGNRSIKSRERPLAQGENPRPKASKAEKSPPSKPQPQQRPQDKPLNYSAPKPVRTSAQQKADAQAKARQGEVRGTIGNILKTVGKELNPGRSPVAVRQTVRTLKALLGRSTSPAQKQRIQGLLDKLK
jgi:hypothetical protein